MTSVGPDQPRSWDRLTDTAALLAVVGLGALATAIAVAALDGEAALGVAAGVVGLGCLVAAGVLAARATRRDQVSLRATGVRMIDLLDQPPAGWVFAVYGAAVLLPFLALHGTVLLGPSGNSLVGDADSARLVSSVRYVQDVDWRFLVRTQEFVLPHVLYGPALLLWGLGGAVAVSLLTFVGFGGLVSYLNWRLSASTMAAVLAPFALAAVNIQTRFGVFLPMYPLALLLGYAGVYLAHLAAAGRGRRAWLLPFAAGALLAASAEAHTIGQLFWPVPALLIVVDVSRRQLLGILKVYAALAVCLLPRLFVNVADGGLAYLRSGRVDYWVTEGYITLTNQEFFGRLGSGNRLDYLKGLAEAIARSSRWPVILLVLLVLAAAVLSKGRLRWFALACFGFMVAVMVVTKVPAYPRYYSPILPGVAMASAGGIALLHRRGGALKGVAVVLAVLVVIASAVSLSRVGREVIVRREVVAEGPYHELAAAIDDDKAVIGVRGHQLNWVDANIHAYGPQFLSEKDYVTYLTWPSDRRVLRMFDRHDIGWIMTMPDRRLEAAFNDAWLGPAHDARARHLARLERSGAVCHVVEDHGYDLYKVGPCA